MGRNMQVVVYFDKRGIHVVGESEDSARSIKHFWLAVHGKPVLFWKGTSGLKFPCFTFMHANGTGPFEFRAVPIL